MIQFEASTYCSNHAKSIKTIADADEKEKIEVKPIFMCPVKKCDTKLSFKVLKKKILLLLIIYQLFWTSSCCSAAIRKHSMGKNRIKRLEIIYF